MLLMMSTIPERCVGGAHAENAQPKLGRGAAYDLVRTLQFRILDTSPIKYVSFWELVPFTGCVKSGAAFTQPLATRYGTHLHQKPKGELHGPVVLVLISAHNAQVKGLAVKV